MSASWLPAVLTLFCGSGAATLIYEVVWLQQLELVIGSSTASMGILLGTFMAGLCIGSAVAPRVAARTRRPMRVYAALELAIGAMGVGLLFALPIVERIYGAAGAGGAAGVLVRELFAALYLLPPTIAMGAALPIAARAVDQGPRAASWIGWMYAANTAGAVAGALVAGFYLLRVHDLASATYAAAAINVLVAAAALAVPARAAERDRGITPRAATPLSQQRVLVVIGLSGFCALAAEIVWTRLLALLFGATVYTFSLIASVFLIGIGAGSAAGAVAVKRVRRPHVALGISQWLAAAAITWSAHALLTLLPSWPAVTSADAWLVMRTDFARALFAVLPGPLLWGASFPLAVAAVGSDSPEAAAARVYAANTLGAIAGSLLAGLVLLGGIGSQHTQWVMIAVSAAAGALVLGSGLRAKAMPAAAAAIAVACAWLVPPLPGVLVAYGRHAASWTGRAGEFLYVGEGANASVAVTKSADGVLNYHNAGKVQASSEPQDMRLQRMLGHLTTLVPASPRSVLVIGCGAGVTAGAVSIDPRVERVTIAEIEPLVPRVASEYFGPANWNVIRNPRVHVHVDDARHFLMTTNEKFDAITSDPLDPWVKGAAMLYTREFFELAKAHLNPGGVMTLFVQLYESSPDTVRSEAATFFQAFPEATIWGNTFDGATADTVLLGQIDGAPYIDVDAIDVQLQQPPFAPVRRSLGEVGFFSAVDLFASYGGRAPDLGEWLRGAPINTDRNLRLEYVAGLGFNMHQGTHIYSEILKYRQFPEELFAPSAVDIREAIEGPRE